MEKHNQTPKSGNRQCHTTPTADDDDHFYMVPLHNRRRSLANVDSLSVTLTFAPLHCALLLGRPLALLGDRGAA